MSANHDKAEAVFDAALNVKPEERAAFLADACGSDVELRRRVEELLQAHSEADDFLPTEPGGSGTVVVDAAAQSSTVSAEQRLTAGTLWAARFRIVGLLGEGGMGKVYRADDLKLGQSVALKFLPHGLAIDPVWLMRFRNEVRIAREVAHPNVCRVYDIGEAEGEHFISMEFVDGENLALLLRRIGRLPQDKAVEIARQLCAGLAAAHDKGVLHRDLKPANIMIDGRGKVRITDFGIAALGGIPAGEEIRAGTPAYMPPEQFAGTEVSVRSDLYSLGLVFYELFTGRKAIDAESLTEIERAHQRGTLRTPSSHIKDLDVQVERIILQCLEKDPKDRPRSAVAVAAALPGADLLAAAIAQGETPSPEMLAEAGETRALRPAVALPCLAGTILLLLAVVALKDRINLYLMVPHDKPPEVLADRAQEICKRLGYPQRPKDRAFWFSRNEQYVSHILDSDKSPDRWKRLASGRPPALLFEYRASPAVMTPQNLEGRVNRSDPPFNVPGMMRVQLDTQGRLLEFESVPTTLEERLPAEKVPVWSALFAEAELNVNQFTPTPPVNTPPVYCDRFVAWTGAQPWQTNRAMRVEAGSYRGVPVHFTTDPQWSKGQPAPPRGLWSEFLSELPWWGPLWAPLIIVFGAALYLARQNLAAGRGDRRGAARLACYVFVVSAAEWLLTAHNVWSPRTLKGTFLAAAGATVASWIFYVALEPYARRHWPHTLVSWSRLLRGQWRDSSIGRDVLFGSLLGAAFAVIEVLRSVIPAWTDIPPAPPYQSDWPLMAARYAAAQLFDALGRVPSFIGVFLALLLLRLVFRRQWLAVAVFLVGPICWWGVEVAWISADWLTRILEWLAVVGQAGILVIAIVRFGLLGIVVQGVTATLLVQFPSTLDFSTWWAGTAMLAPVFAAALAAYGCWRALASPPAGLNFNS